MSIISLAAVALGASTLYHMSPPTAASLAKKSIRKTCSNVGEREHSCERQIWVDTPMNTWLRDDRQNLTTVAQTSEYVRDQYVKEASEHPGVRLVAHTVK